MTLEQLRIFVAVADRRHMTRAAEALGLTQSAASAAVATLEARYGVALFDRVGRGIDLTEAGRVFLPEARAVLAGADAAAQALNDPAGLRRGQVTVFASQTIASYWLPPHLARFARAHPQIVLTLKVGNTGQVARGVREGEAELGFVEGLVEEASLERTLIGGDHLTIVGARDHPLAQGGAVDRDDLLSAAWVLREPGSGTRSEFESALKKAGVPAEGLDIRLELPSNEAVLAAAASSDLLCAVSELAARPLIAAGPVRALAFDLPARSFALLTRRDRRRGRASAAFLQSLEEAPSS